MIGKVQPCCASTSHKDGGAVSESLAQPLAGREYRHHKRDRRQHDECQHPDCQKSSEIHALPRFLLTIRSEKRHSDKLDALKIANVPRGDKSNILSPSLHIKLRFHI